MKKFLALALLTLSLSACSDQPEDPYLEAEPEEVTEEAAESEESMEMEAELTDVNTKEVVGSAIMTMEEGYTYLSAQAELPELEEGYFYEGWIVRSEPLSVVSTGAMEALEFRADVFEFNNHFEIEGDYTDHPKYIITLEPDDGDPAPAGHVADGTLAL